MNIPQLSIIIPVYNAENFIARCVDSILSQSFTDYELLLIDDGSTDESSAICDEYANRYRQVKVFHQNNAGPSVARNKGIEESKGEWIVFVDADDSVLPNYLQVIFEKGMSSDVTFFSNYICYEDGTRALRQLPNSLATTSAEQEKIICHLKQNDEEYEYFGYTWNKVFKASTIREHRIRFIEGLIIREDEIFTASVIQQANSISTLSDSIYLYGYSMLGLTGRKKDIWQWKTYLANLLKYMQNWHSEELKRIDTNRVVENLLMSISVEKSIIELLKDCKKCRNIVRQYQIDVSKYSSKSQRFLIGNPVPFVLRKIARLIINNEHFK